MKAFFVYRDNPDGSWSLCPNFEVWGDEWCVNGSWSVLGARLFGLSWANYLRYCMQNGASVQGKNHLYPIIHWKEKNLDFLNELNRRAERLVRKEL